MAKYDTKHLGQQRIYTHKNLTREQTLAQINNSEKGRAALEFLQDGPKTRKNLQLLILLQLMISLSYNHKDTLNPAVNTNKTHHLRKYLMTFIKWRNSYTVGFEQLDTQHEVLIKLINDMFEVVRDKDINISLSYKIDKLIEYTQEHFDYEEKLLEKSGFEFLELHIKAHKELVREVMDLRDLIEKNTDGISSDLYAFLRTWLTNHILKEDMQYKDCLSAINKKDALSEG